MLQTAQVHQLLVHHNPVLGFSSVMLPDSIRYGWGCMVLSYLLSVPIHCVRMMLGFISCPYGFDLYMCMLCYTFLDYLWYVSDLGHVAWICLAPWLLQSWCTLHYIHMHASLWVDYRSFTLFHVKRAYSFWLIFFKGGLATCMHGLAYSVELKGLVV